MHFSQISAAAAKGPSAKKLRRPRASRQSLSILAAVLVLGFVLVGLLFTPQSKDHLRDPLHTPPLSRQAESETTVGPSTAKAQDRKEGFRQSSKPVDINTFWHPHWNEDYVVATFTDTRRHDIVKAQRIWRQVPLVRPRRQEQPLV
jgi:hypothetical protein